MILYGQYLLKYVEWITIRIRRESDGLDISAFCKPGSGYCTIYTTRCYSIALDRQGAMTSTGKQNLGDVKREKFSVLLSDSLCLWARPVVLYCTIQYLPTLGKDQYHHKERLPKIIPSVGYLGRQGTCNHDRSQAHVFHHHHI